MFRENLRKIIQGNDLSDAEMGQMISIVLAGEATDAQIGAMMGALATKGETFEELAGAARAMRRKALRIQAPGATIVDTCGTGGDGTQTFNISTTTAFVVAGCGVTVAKHGNRSVTSKSGSADVLEQLGLNLKMEPKAVKTVIEKLGVGFMFAPAFHPAMKYAIQPRREIGIRTVFNVLGPLTNPASSSAQLLGVYDQKLTTPMAYALKELGCKEAMIVHGLDGLDEISTIQSRISS